MAIELLNECAPRHTCGLEEESQAHRCWIEKEVISSSPPLTKQNQISETNKNQVIQRDKYDDKM